jgi:hypothetical protein
MSRFYAEIQGNRRPVSRQGLDSSGIWGHIRGWNTGVEVKGRINSDGNEEYHIWLTEGSNGNKITLLAKITETFAGGKFVPEVGMTEEMIMKAIAEYQIKEIT